jgi:hypothetical protein
VSNPAFPELSRAPSLRTKTATIDPTLRDPMENGMESTRAKFTRRRRKWQVTIDFLTNDDWTRLETFVQQDAVYGAQIFTFQDNRDPRNPVTLLVRFDPVPTYTDAGYVGAEFRQNASFGISEV